MEQAKKLAYETPVLSEIGTFEAITQAASCGHALDASYSAGSTTLTFSDVPNGNYRWGSC